MDTPQARLTGLCRGIDREGRLLLETEDGLQAFSTGVVRLEGDG